MSEDAGEKKVIGALLSACHSKCSFLRFHEFFEGLNLDDRPDFKTKIEGSLFDFLLSCPKLKSDNALLSALVTRWDKSLE